MSLWLPIVLSAAVASQDPALSRCEGIGAAAVESSPSDGPAQTLTLARALELASTADSPRAAVLRSHVGEAKADVVAAKVAPNPSLDYEGTRLHSGTNTGAATVDQWSLEWPLLMFGQRGARKRAASSGVAAAEAHVEADLAARARDVRVAFDDLLSQQERTRILEEARADLERVAKIVTARKDAGEASEYDSLRVQTEFREMDATLGDARGDLADARGRLAVLLGCPGFTARAVGELKVDAAAPLDVEALWTIASEKLPALSAARRDAEAASAEARAARRDAWPVPVLTGGAVLTQDAQSNSAMFGVSIPLPVLDRNQGAVAHAQAKEDETALERKALEAETRADLERAVAVATKRRAALAELDADVSSRLPEMRSMAESAYREGRGDILELLDAFRSLIATRLARVDAFAGATHADADLLFLTGRPMDATP
jgi:cobalt-zinc-cadmium efflux system outer membrane protein